MKNLKTGMVIITFIVTVSVSYCQDGKVVLNTDQVPDVTHVNLADFPTNEILPMIHGWGGFTVDINNAPAGSDFRPLLVGLENDHCQVPHWGYVVKGAILIEYEDGTSDIFREGEAFYMRAGHTGEVLEDLLLVSFSPEEGMNDLADHLEKRMAELQAQQTSSEN